MDAIDHDDYASSVLDNKPLWFTATAFIGAIVRLLIVLLVVVGVYTVGT